MSKEAEKSISTHQRALEKRAERTRILSQHRLCICGGYIRLAPEVYGKQKIEEMIKKPDNWRHVSVEKAAKFGAHHIEFAEESIPVG